MEYKIEIPDGRHCNGCLLLRNDSFQDYFCMLSGDGLRAKEDAVKKAKSCPCQWGDCKGCSVKEVDRKHYDPK